MSLVCHAETRYKRYAVGSVPIRHRRVRRPGGPEPRSEGARLSCSQRNQSTRPPQNLRVLHPSSHRQAHGPWAWAMAQACPWSMDTRPRGPWPAAATPGPGAGPRPPRPYVGRAAARVPCCMCTHDTRQLSAHTSQAQGSGSGVSRRHEGVARGLAPHRHAPAPTRAAARRGSRVSVTPSPGRQGGAHRLTGRPDSPERPVVARAHCLN
jgi:hypothetical protein